MQSRRTPKFDNFSIIFQTTNWAAGFGLAAPSLLLTVSDAEAKTAGMERRQGRRTGRTERWHARRTGRTVRREERRNCAKPSIEAMPETPALGEHAVVWANTTSRLRNRVHG